MLTIATGNKAVAAAVNELRPAVIAAYPITPQTEIVEQIAGWVASGELDSSYIPVESEHSAMAACIGASVTGARTFTATSSQGLALMHELLHYVSGLRLPIVMANVNRALGSPFNLKADLSDSLAQRDTGWLHGEELRDRADAVTRVGPGGPARRHVGFPEPARPEDLLVVHDGGRHAGNLLVGALGLEPRRGELDAPRRTRGSEATDCADGGTAAASTIIQAQSERCRIMGVLRRRSA